MIAVTDEERARDPAARRPAADRRHAVLHEPDRPGRPARRACAARRSRRSPSSTARPARKTTRSARTATAPCRGSSIAIPDRVLLLVTNFCSVYCRYCTRARLVGASGERALRKADIDRAIEYIAATPAVRDCLISGGDPLSLDEDRLEYVLSRLAGDPASRVHPHRQQAAGRPADARDADADEDAAPLPSAVDEPALHAPGRGDARGRRGLRAVGRRGHSARQPDRAAQGRQRRRRDAEEAVPRAA